MSESSHNLHENTFFPSSIYGNLRQGSFFGWRNRSSIFPQFPALQSIWECEVETGVRLEFIGGILRKGAERQKAEG